MTDVREFKVTVSGNVVSQAVVPASASERVYEAIIKAGGLKGEASIRNIELRRDNEIIIVDLPRYTYLGEQEANPYLRGGDQIYIPSMDEKRIISINGEVVNPGIYEYKEGDKLSDLLAFAKGINSIGLTDSVELYRYEPQTGDVIRYYIDLSNEEFGENAALELNSGDRVYVREKSHYQGDYAVITGEIIKPGRYHINQSMATIKDLYSEGGGLTDKASLENAVLFRRENARYYDPEMARLTKLSVNEMNDLERQYYYSKINEVYAAVSINIKEALDSEEDFVLNHLDSLHIPGQNSFVSVQGRVRKPGLIKYKSGADYMYYINEAGGLSSDADESEIIISKNDNSKFYASDADYVIEVGDYVLVPPEEPIDSEKLITNIIAISAQVLAIVSIGLSLSRN